jgi:hypothetical protein
MNVAKFWAHGFAFGSTLGLLCLLLLLPTDPNDMGREILAIIGAGTVVVFAMGMLFWAAAVWAVSRRRRGVLGKGVAERQ